MNVSELSIPGVMLVEPKIFRDGRGYFVETFHCSRYAASGIGSSTVGTTNFVQDNVSSSRRGVLRGLHYQWPNPQGKLVMVLDGEVFDVAVDIRRGSPTFGRWVAATLRSETRQQLWVPPGFAHGFCVLSASAVVSYKCTALYDAASDASVLWSDPAIGIEWPRSTAPIVSEKDGRAPRLADIPEDRLPSF